MPSGGAVITGAIEPQNRSAMQQIALCAGKPVDNHARKFGTLAWTLLGPDLLMSGDIPRAAPAGPTVRDGIELARGRQTSP